MEKIAIKFCPSCSASLTLDQGHYGRTCSSCKLPCGDDVQEGMHGHYVCSGEVRKHSKTKPSRDNNSNRCNFHCCLSCYHGVDVPVVVTGPMRCSNARCSFKFSADVPMCGENISDDHNEKPVMPFCWVWEGAEAVAKCPLCQFILPTRPGRSTLPCLQKDCDGTATTLLIGQPRGLPDRRRPRSPSPQNVKREPSSSSRSSSDDNEEEQQEAPKSKQPAPKKKPAAKTGRKQK